MDNLKDHMEAMAPIEAQAETAAPTPVPFGVGGCVAERSVGAVEVVLAERMLAAPAWWADLCEMAMEDGEAGNAASAYRMALIAVERCPEGAAPRLVGNDGFRYCVGECLNTARSETVDAAIALAGRDPFLGTHQSGLTDTGRVRLARLALRRAVSLLTLLAKAFGGSTSEDVRALERALDGLIGDDEEKLGDIARGASELCGNLDGLVEAAVKGFEGEVEQVDSLVDALSDSEVLEEANRLIAIRYGIGVEVPMLMEECCELGKAASKYLRSSRGFGVPRAAGEARESLAEEISDVYMMCEQIRILAGIGTDEIRAGVIRKVARTMRRAGISVGQAVHGSETCV